MKLKSLSCVQLLVTPWTAAYQAPLSMGFSRQEYWSGLPLPSPARYARISLLENKKMSQEAPVHLIELLMVCLPIGDIGADCYNK